MSQAKIDRDLNLVVPLDRDDGTTVYVHATPIGRDVFRRYARVLGSVYSEIRADPKFGLGAAPRLGMILLEDVAKGLGKWEGPEGVEAGLLNELRRLTMVVSPTEQGWQPIMLDEAQKRGAISDDEAEEVLGLVAFFTVVWRVAPLNRRMTLVEVGTSPFAGQTTPSNSTEYARSLPTSTATGPSILKVA